MSQLERAVDVEYVGWVDIMVRPSFVFQVGDRVDDTLRQLQDLFFRKQQFGIVARFHQTREGYRGLLIESVLGAGALVERLVGQPQDAAVLKQWLAFCLLFAQRSGLNGGCGNWFGCFGVLRRRFVAHSFLLEHLAYLHGLVSAHLRAIISFEDATVKCRRIFLTHA